MSKKYFRVAVAGATVDGRTIKPEWLTQAAANYDPEVYGARVWIEHMRSTFADGSFTAQGDVIELKAEEIKTGKLAGKMALFAAIEPLDDLVKLNKRGKKVFTSIEIEPKFADTGEAYMTGLAVTDDPASLGTEALKFSAAKNAKKFASDLHETTLEYGSDDADDDEEDLPTPAAKKTGGVMSKLLARFRKNEARQDDAEKFNAQTVELIEAAADSVEEMEGRLAKVETENKALKKSFNKLQAAFDEQTESLSKQDSGTIRRPKATGNEGGVNADC